MGALAKDVLEALQARLAANPGAKAFAVLDGARDPLIWPEVLASGNGAVCLFAGDKPPELEAVAPWLVELGNLRDALTDLVVGKGWGESWGVFMFSSLTRANLSKHLRHFLLVKRGGKQVFFRFYDPRVLRVYLPTCAAADLDVVMGEAITELVMEAEDPATLLSFRRAGDAVARAEVALGEKVRLPEGA